MSYCLHFLSVAKKYSNVKLLMLGGMDNHESLQLELMEQAKASANITFYRENVPNVEEYYAASDNFL